MDAVRILTNGEYGILSTVGSDGQPYGIPLNFVFKENSIYFHCAQVGHKIDNLAQNPKVSFCVVGPTHVLPSEFGTEYESAIVFGTASDVQEDEKYKAMIWLLEKYSREFIEEGKKVLQKYDQATKVVKIEIEGISGKARR